MYLNSLIIKKTFPELEIIREVNFKRGLNIVVDESENVEEQGNNVGKTTFLKIIDICLGAKDKKYIWTDNDTGSENTNLKDFINDNRVEAELVFEDFLGENYKTRVQLFDRGSRFINEKKYNIADFHEELNQIIFGIYKPPTFRQLISKFVRISQKNDLPDNILKYLHQTTTNLEYRNIYEFLFKLTSKDISAEKMGYQNEIKATSDDIVELMKLHNFSNIDDLNERIRIVSQSVKKLEEQFNLVIQGETTIDKIQKVSFLKNKILKLEDIHNSLIFQKQKIEKILVDEEENPIEVNRQVLKDLYDEVNIEFPSIQKKFSELIEFNNQLKGNRLKYYRHRKKNLEEEIGKINIHKEMLYKENAKLLSLISANNYKEFEEIHANLMQQNQLLGESLKIKELYDGLVTQRESATKALEELLVDDDAANNITLFNNFFTELSQEVLGQRLYLTVHDPFPVKLSNVDDGIGTGHKKTITLLLDIAYVSFMKALRLDYPYFFVHDVIETIDEYHFSKIAEAIEENGSQFICAVLKEKISNYNFINEDDIRLSLSIENRLFQV